MSDEENEFCEVFTTLDSPSGPITLNQKTTHVHQPAIPSPLASHSDLQVNPNTQSLPHFSTSSASSPALSLPVTKKSNKEKVNSQTRPLTIPSPCTSPSILCVDEIPPTPPPALTTVTPAAKKTQLSTQITPSPRTQPFSPLAGTSLNTPVLSPLIATRSRKANKVIVKKKIVKLKKMDVKWTCKRFRGRNRRKFFGICLRKINHHWNFSNYFYLTI